MVENKYLVNNKSLSQYFVIYWLTWLWVRCVYCTLAWLAVSAVGLEPCSASELNDLGHVVQAEFVVRYRQ